MFKDISIEKAMQIDDKVIIDVRSPGEYIAATVPGAINVPLLDNVERSLIGTLYKREGPEPARDLAMKIISPKLPVIVKSIKEASKGKPVLLFCWRGGERSLFIANILNLMKFKVYRVSGGFKAYRNQVRKYFEQETLPLKAIVLHGLTGVGKTEMLKALKEQGMPVLDLEGLSSHRGSVFGKIGMPPSPSQKMFEALIMRELKDFWRYGVFVVECESKRLGSLVVPGSLMRTMKNGYNILLYASIEDRVKRIKEIYASQFGVEQSLQKAVGRLVKYIGKNKVKELNEYIQQGNIERAVRYLFVSYYDPLYGYPDAPDHEYDFSVSMGDTTKAASVLMDYIQNLPEFGKPYCRGGVLDGDWTNLEGSPGEVGYTLGNGGTRD